MLKPSLLFLASALAAAAVCLPLAGRSPQATDPTRAQAQTAAAPSQNPVKPTPESLARAKAIYQRDCALCHGANGNGKTDVAASLALTLDDWTDPKTLANKPDSDLFAIIRNGKDKMPAEATGRANDTEVWNLIAYIRAFPKAQSPAAAPAAQ